MTSLVPRRAPYICRSCRAHSAKVTRRTFTSTFERPATLRGQLQAREKTGTSIAQQSQISQSQVAAQHVPAHLETSEHPQDPTTSKNIQAGIVPVAPTSVTDLKTQLRRIQINTLDVLDQQEKVPEEEQIIEILNQAAKLSSETAYAQAVAVALPAQSNIQQPTKESRSVLGDLEEQQDRPRITDSIRLQAELQTIGRETAKALYTLLEDPKVFISDDSLTIYIRILAALNLPEYSPKIFHLYAHKPVPTPGTSPIKYTQPWSRNAKYAIHLPLVDAMMDCAILQRDMPLCVSIIDTTVATPQYFAAKFIKTASIPMLGVGALIPISWALSQRAAALTPSWEPETFFWMCMAGGGAYLGTMGTLLYITVTTWNDHHKRVRWVPGTPMGKRWFREEERAYFDKMALAWGFQDSHHFGEETGDEWEAFREMLAFKYMDLDRSALLPGML